MRCVTGASEHKPVVPSLCTFLALWRLCSQRPAVSAPNSTCPYLRPPLATLPSCSCLCPPCRAASACRAFLSMGPAAGAGAETARPVPAALQQQQQLVVAVVVMLGLRTGSRKAPQQQQREQRQQAAQEQRRTAAAWGTSRCRPPSLRRARRRPAASGHRCLQVRRLQDGSTCMEDTWPVCCGERNVAPETKKCATAATDYCDSCFGDVYDAW